MQPGDPAVTGKTGPRTSGFEANRACVWENQRVVGNRDSALKTVTQNLTHYRSSTEAVISKEPESDPLANVEEPPGKARGKWNFCWRHTF